jgi:glycosyltransferase involved in cell wall biosynthesis
LPKSAGRVAWHIHDLLGDRTLLAGVLRYAAGHVCGVIAISQAVADDLKKVLPGTPVYAVLNGVDVEHYSPGKQSIDRERASVLDTLANLPPAPDDTVRIGLIATYARWKGQDVFLKAAAQIESFGVRFYIIGGSIYQTSGSSFTRDELHRQADVLGIAARVGFIDFQSDPLAIYRALDVVVHASVKPEPFGRTIAEGMACGRAVIVSAGGGAMELFTDGVDALGTMPGNADMLAENMRRLIDNRTLRNSLGEQARQTAVHRFDRKRLGPEMLAIYQRACGIMPTAD